MDFPADDYNICPSCGVEFVADTTAHGIEVLRSLWIARGMSWTSRALRQPADYDPVGQLEALIPHGANISNDHAQGLFHSVAQSEGKFKMRPANTMTRGTIRQRLA